MTPEVTAALRAIADQNGGRLTPTLVVHAAKSPESPLHAHFTWNTQKAAEELWIIQARDLIRSVRVEVTTTEFTVRAPQFVRDPGAAADKQGYISLGRLRTDLDLAREAVIAEFSAASSALRRAKNVAAALGMEAQVEEVRERVDQLSEHALQATA